MGRWVPPLVFGAVWTSLGVATEIVPGPMHWWAVVAPTALTAVAVMLAILAWPLRSRWLVVVAGLLVVLPSAPWRLDWFVPSTSFTTLQGYEMSRADELLELSLLALTPTSEVLLPGLLLLAAALFGFLVNGAEGWTPLLGTGLGSLAFAVSDEVERLNGLRMTEFTVYDGSHDRLPLSLLERGTPAWPDLTFAAVSFGLLVWAFVRRDHVVAVTAAVFGGVAWLAVPPTPSGEQFGWVQGSYAEPAFWEGVPKALTPACVLLAGAALAYLLDRRQA